MQFTGSPGSPGSLGSLGISGSGRVTFGPLENMINIIVFITLGVQLAHLGGAGEPKAAPGGPGGVQGTLSRPRRGPRESKRGPQVVRKPSPGGQRRPRESSLGPGRVHRNQKQVLQNPKKTSYCGFITENVMTNPLRIPSNQWAQWRVGRRQLDIYIYIYIYIYSGVQG